MGEDENEFYQDPSFYAGVQAGVFGMIDSIWNLVDRAEGNNPQQQQQQPAQQDNKNIYIGMGVIGVLVLFLIVVVLLKK